MYIRMPYKAAPVPYGVRTVEEAKLQGYSPSKLHFPTIEPCKRFIARMLEQAEWLRLLTPDRIAMMRPYLDPTPLRRAFIIVDQIGSPGHVRRSTGDRYCIWSRDVSRDN